MTSRLERAALRATDAAAKDARTAIRGAMASAGLGRLGNAIGADSDLVRHRIKREGAGFSASGTVYIRGRSPRTQGAIQIYSEGGDIAPTRGWLWIATPEIPRRVGRKRMTPALYNSAGLDQKIGPLVFRKGRHGGEAVLIVSGATLDKFGRAGRARRLPKRGRVGETRTGAVSFVAFVGIRRTRRGARYDPAAIIAHYRDLLPRYLAEGLSS